MWKCKDCGKINTDELPVCSDCGKNNPSQKFWYCPNDNTAISITERYCPICHFDNNIGDGGTPIRKPKRYIIIIALVLIIGSTIIFSLSNRIQTSSPPPPVITRIITATPKDGSTSSQTGSTAVPIEANTSYSYLESKKTFLLGPNSGVLTMKPSPIQVDAPEGVDLYNFISEIKFYNPYDGTQGQWDYGFSFRDDGYKALVLLIRSDGKWVIVNKAGDSLKISSQGYLDNLLLGDGQANKLKIIVNNNVAWLFINDVLIEEITLPSTSTSGNIGAYSGYFQDDVISGSTTNYDSWMIWSLD